MTQFIPLQGGQGVLAKEQKMLSSLLGYVGYEVEGGYVVFTEDISELSGRNIQGVDMKLVVMDYDKYGDYDVLPLSASMAADIVQEVYALLMQTPPPDKKNDPMGEETINKR